jgi:RNA polymerase sigma factor (sigma-70 family)
MGEDQHQPLILVSQENGRTLCHVRHQRRKLILTPLFLATAAVAMNRAAVDAFSSFRIPNLPSRHALQRSEPLFATKRIRVVATENRDLAFEPAQQQSASRQFMPRYKLYELEILKGKLPEETELKKANPNSLPTLEERTRTTDKIARLLNDVTEIEETGTLEIADRATVFAQLSDEDKSEATFAVSREGNQFQSDSDPIRLHNSAKKGKLTANVMETGRDTMKQYVKSMANHQVLSPEDEAVLGRHIQVLVKWEEQRQQLEHNLLRYVCCILLSDLVLFSYHSLTYSTITFCFRSPTFVEWADSLSMTVPALKTQVRQSHKAKAAMIEANLRLVVSVARQTVKSGRSDINFQDACQEGILGLSRACEKFDPSKGFRFSTYATWWIRKMIHKNVSEQSSAVRLPANVMRKVNDIRIHEKVLMDELGRKPHDEEIAEKVGITLEQLDFYRRSVRSVESLDKKVKFNNKGDNNGNSPDLHSLVMDSGSTPTELMDLQFLREDVRRLIKTLSPREQAVIRLRFGLDGDAPKTLEEIAKKFKSDKEKVRKIETCAIRKLRQPYRNGSLKGYIMDIDN